jgi:hypothetical protein
MATEPGMFTGLNKYEAELIDDATQRQASSADVGTGWAAMTNAAGRAGGMIGRSVGRGLGGVTTAEQRVADFQKIVSSVPDFNPNKVESLQAMSSAMWRGGFYDQAKDMMDTANIYQRNLAEVAKIEQETKSFESATSLSEKRFILEKDMNGAQIKQINELIFDAQYGRLNEDWEMELKADFNKAQIDQIAQLIDASKSEVTRADKAFDLSKKIGDAQVDEIEQQIENLKSDVKVDSQQIKESQQNIKQSKALIDDLSLTDQARNFEFAQENGNYDGTFAEYQELMANLKTVANETSINLFEYAQTPAGGSYEGTLEDFVTSITGVDYKIAVAEADRAADDLDTTYYSLSATAKNNLVDWLDDEVDSGFWDFAGAGDTGIDELADHIFQIAKNTGKTPKVVWNHYGEDAAYIMKLPVTRSLKPYTEKVAGQGGSDDDGSGLKEVG